jgi:hypothetical protein
MYPWDKSADSGQARRQQDAQEDSAQEDSPATQAVQVALDRRDNGGDALSEAGQPAARQTRQ